MKHLYRTLIIFMTTILVVSCTGNFQDLNRDKTGITEEGMSADYYNLIVPLDIIQQGIYFNYDFGKGKNWPFQIMQNLNVDMFSGYMHDYKPHNGGSHNTVYDLQEGWNSSNWLHTYAYIMPQIKKSEDSSAEKYPVINAVTKILKVETMHRICDIYGPIIYTHFGDETGNYSVETQEEAYYAFFRDLNEAIDILNKNLDNSIEEKILTRADILMNGTIVSYIKFANSLKMRLAIRIAMIDPQKAREEFISALDNNIGVFENPSEMAAVSPHNGYLNPLGEINKVWNEAQMNASMESILTGYEDPRLGIYFEPCSADITITDALSSRVVELKGKYKGIRQGTGYSHNHYETHSRLYVAQDSKAILMTAAEVWFLRAEAALRGWTSESAGECYALGVESSFKQWNLSSDVQDYLMKENIAADYIDAFTPEYNIEARCRVSPKWIEEADDETKLEKILTQKWIAIFPEGCEAWSEQRRTGYPRLFPVMVNKSNGVIDTEKMIRRINFPKEMAESDPQQYLSLQRALNGEDNAGTSLWWDTGRNF